MAESTRAKGWEWQAAIWTARHPQFAAVPGTLAAGALEYGITPTGAVVGGAGAAVCAWRRAHPDSFDFLVAPRVRATVRRWGLSCYRGSRWRDVLMSCDLTPTHRRTGQTQVPRILSVRSPSPSVDVLKVRMVKGQSARQWEARAIELADAMRAERVAVERVRPQVLTVVVQRTEPFGHVLPAPAMPWDSADVDLSAIPIGEDEYGAELVQPLAGQHWFVAGATGSGKNSVTWAPIRAIAPLVRDGLARLWLVDPKRTELAPAREIAHAYAAEPDGCLQVIKGFAESMRATQRRQSERGQRSWSLSEDTPFNVLVLDELAMLMAYSASQIAREIRGLLGEIATQGRSTGHSLIGAVQEPSKDIVPIRDLFTVRLCMRVTSAAHVDMVLGDGMRLRGALADEVPNHPGTAGVGYVVRQRSRAPMRFRAGWTDDQDLTDLVEHVTRFRPPATLRSVPDVA